VIDASMPVTDAAADIAELAKESGLTNIHLLAWRDLDDVEAGGSEIHAAKIAELWSEAGLSITMRASYAQGQPPRAIRDGYTVIRRGGRYGVFPHAILSEITERHGPNDALVEIWNGVPFLSPIWYHKPRIVVIHHVHRKMWDMVLDERMAKFGRLLEGTLAPPFYRRSQIVTPSESSREEIITLLGLPEQNITVAYPGIDKRFQPSAPKAEHPLIVSCGRLMPPKKFDEMIRIAHEVRKTHQDLELVIVGDGYERLKLQQLVTDLDAHDWVRLAGRVSDEELVWLYQRAWVLASASTAEGWGMTITEAAACGTPAVCTRIAGHRDSVADNQSGLLGDNTRDMVEKLSRVLEDTELRTRLSEGALKRAADFTWEKCAYDTFAPLARDAMRRRRKGS
jgi:glycosyltransferase involved in cell wall biosynthesis